MKHPDQYTIRTSYRMWAEGPGNPFANFPGSPTPVYDPDLPANTWVLERNGNRVGEPGKISKTPGEDIRSALLSAGAKVAERPKVAPKVVEPEATPPAPAANTTEPIDAQMTEVIPLNVESHGRQMTWTL